MSSTGRGLPRVENDFYPTPKWLTRAIVPKITNRPDHIFEPACGKGAIVDVMAEAFPKAAIVERDLVNGFDFLTAEPLSRFDLIITNPPFSLAQEFIERAMLWRRDESSLVVMLLRLNFLGSQKRAEWWRSRPMPAVYVTPRRPPFGKNKHGKIGTDSTEYGWFVWGKPTTLEILPTEQEAA